MDTAKQDPGLDIDAKNLDLLLEQRQTLVDDIKAFVTHQFTILCAAAAFIGVAVPILLTRQDNLLPVPVVFLLVEVFIGFLYILYGIYTAMNCDRDYIRAIDKYIGEKYGIHKLFYQGDLLFQHINKMSSRFAKMTFVGALIGGGIVILLICLGFGFVLQHYEKTIMDYWYFFLIIVGEALHYLWLMVKLMEYKKTGNSKNYTDCLHYLRTGNYHSISAKKKGRAKR